MNKKNYQLSVLAFLGLGTFAFAQQGNVGINTDDPKVTLDIVGKPTEASKADGLLAPRLTGTQLAAKDNVYDANKKGTLVFVTEGINSNRTTKTANVDAPGYYYFDGSVWVKVGSGSGQTPIVYTAGTGVSISSNNQISRQTPWNIWKTGNTSTAVTDNIYQNGKISLGADFSGSTITDTDVAQLQIAGGGQQQIGLFSDANGGSKMYIGHETGQGLTVSVGGNKDRKLFLKYDGTFYLGNITAADQSGTGHSLAYSSTEKRLYLKGDSTDNISLQTSKGIKVEQFAGQGDRPVYADQNGVLKLGQAHTAGTGISITNGVISRQTPWNLATTSNTATTVDNNIYQKGNVGIGDFSSSTLTAKLEVLGGGTSQLRISRASTQDKWDVSSENGGLTFTSRVNENGTVTDKRLFGLSHNGKVTIGFPLYDAAGTGANFIYDSVIQKLTLRGGDATNNVSLETSKRVKVGELPEVDYTTDKIIYADANGVLKKGATTSQTIIVRLSALADQDWIENFNTSINATKYDVSLISFNFVNAEINATAGTYVAPTIEAFIEGGTWRVKADYKDISTKNNANGTWYFTLMVTSKGTLKEYSHKSSAAASNTHSVTIPELQ